MIKMKRMRVIALLIAAALLLSACVDMNTDIWVNPDHSGKFSLDLGLSGTLVDMVNNQGGMTPDKSLAQMAATLAANPGVANVNTRVYQSGDMRHSVIEFEAPAMPALNLNSLSAAGALQVRVTEIAVGEFTLQIQIEEQSLISGMVSQLPQGISLTDPSIQAALIGRNFTVRAHVPEVMATNGTVNPADQTVQWQVPIGQILAGDADLNFFVTYKLEPKAVPPNPLYLVGAGLLALLFVLLGAFLLVRHARNRRAQAAWAQYGYRNAAVPPYPGAHPTFAEPHTQPTRPRRSTPSAVPPPANSAPPVYPPFASYPPQQPVSPPPGSVPFTPPQNPQDPKPS